MTLFGCVYLAVHIQMDPQPRPKLHSSSIGKAWVSCSRVPTVSWTQPDLDGYVGKISACHPFGELTGIQFP